ncbi:MAG: hypothetical protein ACK55I_38810, partial [bacterium]
IEIFGTASPGEVEGIEQLRTDFKVGEMFRDRGPKAGQMQSGIQRNMGGVEIIEQFFLDGNGHHSTPSR